MESNDMRNKMKVIYKHESDICFGLYSPAWCAISIAEHCIVYQGKLVIFLYGF